MFDTKHSIYNLLTFNKPAMNYVSKESVSLPVLDCTTP